MEFSDSTTAVVAIGFGGPEMLLVTQVPIGLPGPGQVRLRVRAAGTNQVDYKLYSGAIGRDPGQLPMRLGREAAGVVVAAGSDAEGPMGPVAVGDEVIAFPAQGAYAVDLVVPAATLVRKPATLSFEEASGLMVTGTTAAHFMKAASVGEGDLVLIHGASGVSD